MDTIPKHVAIIPDGNRRWAKEKGLPTLEGHRQGFEAAKKIAKKARDLGVTILTMWAFSTENWNRSKEEVGYLMKLFETLIDDNLKEALEDKVRLIHLGRKDRISDGLRKKIIDAEEQTKQYDDKYLCIALDYGGHDEILRAMQKIHEEGKNTVNDEEMYKYLDTNKLPHPNIDLIIRTSGEMRTSGFFIWQAAYAEYIFIKQHFPAFTPEIFEECIKEYSQRQRRFGH